MSGKRTEGGNMPCPKCGGITRVTDTRPQKGERLTLRRRRICQSCPNRFRTVEIEMVELTTTKDRIRYRTDLMDRYLALNGAGKAAVRNLIAALETAKATKPDAASRLFATGGVVKPGTYLVGERA